MIDLYLIPEDVEKAKDEYAENVAECMCCPIAQALRRKFHTNEVSVLGPFSIRVGHSRFKSGDALDIYNPVSKFINWFDEHWQEDFGWDALPHTCFQLEEYE